MNCEIEFLPVGNASKAGDAIVVRYGTPDAYELMIIDGGFAETGEEIVTHVRAQFGNHPIAHVLLTHGDRDHASGLHYVLKELDVRNFWLHMPWDIDATVLPYFADKQLTVESLQKTLIAEYDVLAELVKIAIGKNIPIRAPVAGMQIGPFWALTPTRRMYHLLLPQFDRTPEPDEAALRAIDAWLGKGPPKTAFGVFLDKAAAAFQKIFTESWTNERLKEGAQTSAANESSVVLYGYGYSGPVLLTGDAGVQALTTAADYADARNLPLRNFSFVQVPHHGSRSNVGPTILDRLIGPKQEEGRPSRCSAFVSAPKDDATHPRQMVVNAFLRRGAQVVATQGTSKVHWGGFPPRRGYTGVSPIPFVARVEDYD